MGFYDWLHGRWPAGTVEALPEVAADGTTRIPGLRVVGDLTGVPLLKFAADSGARAVQAILAEPDFTARRGKTPGVVDVAILGAGVSGLAAALEAKKAGLEVAWLEARAPFATIADFPLKKPIYTYPNDFAPAGDVSLEAVSREGLLADLEAQRAAAGLVPTVARVSHVEHRVGLLVVNAQGDDGPAHVSAHRVIVALGRSGEHRTLGVPGETRAGVSHRLHDPADFAGRDVLVVGGGDSAVEATAALAEAGARVTLAHRSPSLTRPKPQNLARLAALVARASAGDAAARPTLHVRAGTTVRAIDAHAVTLVGPDGAAQSVANDAVFVMIGREAPLDFFRRTGVPIRGEWRPAKWLTLAFALALCTLVYTWKSGGAVTRFFETRGWFPFGLPAALGALGDDPATLLGTLRISLGQPGFHYSLAYTAAVVAFGVRRIRRRRTPYVTAQTLTLVGVQVIPLFLLPYLLLPWLGHNGIFEDGVGKYVADQLFPAVTWDPHGREYWRAFGFVLAWPLFLWNFFTAQPLGWWLAIGGVQTFVVIPLIVWRWGKGAYCGFICSCGALAETLGDAHREKMPHGPFWNRLNMVGQALLALVTALFALRIVAWTWPATALGRRAAALFQTLLTDVDVLGVPLDYYHLVDVFLAGIVGVGLYFHFSGRVWCRFACPLAALMHLYARFSRFRIFADKKKCISCGACTATCHQGIDVMGFANRGAPMEDPQCVRCSACVQACPTGVLSFGRLGTDGAPVYDALAASLVPQREGAAKRRLPLVR
jgi:NosR/NirI family nitrous oxide reductase transcriptional regulator